ncbi:MAG: hypothetical protein V3S01_05015 [Dehalococcoidia bacterium]
MAETVIQSTEPTEARGVVLRDLAVIAGCFAGLSAIYWTAVLVVCGGPGFPLDDSFIHLQFARNFYEHGQMAFKPGVPSSGSTAPMYAVLIAGAYHLVRNWYLASHLLGGLCSLGTAMAVYGITHSWTGRRNLARWAGLLTVFAAPTVVQAYSGMESAAYSLFFLVGLWLYGFDSRRLFGSAVLALTIWLRPELACLCPLILLERAVATRRRGGRWLAAWLADAWPHLLIWVAMALAYMSYHWHQDQHLVPSTFAAKVLVPFTAKPAWMDNLPTAAQNHRWGMALLAMTVWPFLVLLAVGVGIGTICAPLAFGLREAIVGRWRGAGPAAAGWRLAIMTLIGYPFLRGMVDTLGVLWFQQHRYYAHLTPLAILLVLGALPITGAVVKRGRWNWSGVSLALQARRTLRWACLYSLVLGVISVISVSNITSMQVEIAEWLREDTTEGELIATNDIGAIGFISRRPILDTVGLVEPGLVEHVLSGGDLLEYLQERKPARVVIFPNWYKKLSARRDLLEPIHDVKLDYNIICGGPRMVVYRPLWRRSGSE